VFLERVGAVLGANDVQNMLDLLSKNSVGVVNIGVVDEARHLYDSVP
jgi:hypothetical protein